MGVLNVTADSFSDGGRYLRPDDALDQGRRMIAEGADIVDVGGESSRPGAAPIGQAEELRRVVPVVEALAAEVRVSIDTVKPEVARAAVTAGATLVNDVSASLAEVAADLGAGYVVMHRQGTPQTMQVAPHYDDVVAEVRAFLAHGAARAAELGIDEVWVDPGIGFGKTMAHNLALLAHLDQLVELGRPVLVGTSRKGFLGTLVGRSDARGAWPGLADEAVGAPDDAGRAQPTPAPEAVPADDRLEASLATATWAMAQGARMVRVHDVGPTLQAAKVVAA
jgi:dihydropteroate synthase